MFRTIAFEDTFERPAADQLISFSVICRPASGLDVEGVRARLAGGALEEIMPAEEVRAGVARQLKELGFEVFDIESPVVHARGTAERFQSVFKCELTRRTRQVVTEPRGGLPPVSCLVLRSGSTPPAPEAITGALLISIAEPPVSATPRTPLGVPGQGLRVPGDVAQLTGTSATHRRSTPSGQRATGARVRVAVIDTGFARHPFYGDHGYTIVRLSAPDVTAPDLDPDPSHDEGPHGTLMLACLLACAPDARVYGIKYNSAAAAVAYARTTIPRLKVISLSWAYYLPTTATAADEPADLKAEILLAVNAGITVVAAAGNGGAFVTFPAMMPEVIAAGGVAVDQADAISAWGGATSFDSAVYKGRRVPDLCGLSSDILLPDPGPPYGWRLANGTSCAAPQVAGAAALLLQKVGTLTPAGVRAALTAGAVDVVAGTTASGDSAHVGPDQATGAGLVNALGAWKKV